MKQNKDIYQRAYLVAIPFLVLAIFIVANLLRIQHIEGEALRTEVSEKIILERPIEAKRGNIYSSDGVLLATSLPIFSLYMDPVTVHKDTFSNRIDDLAKHLAKEIPSRSSSDWKKYISNARYAGDSYIFLAKEISYPKLQRIKGFPIFKLGKHSGGLIYVQHEYRENPMGKLAERTIGYHRKPSIVGLEGAYNRYLAGTQGSRLMQKVNQKQWKPITVAYAKIPKDGYDVVCTIDSRIQDWTHHALHKQLLKSEADHGCAVVMDTKTGAIKAIANLGRSSTGEYYEKRNYAVWESTEPGSTFKLASVLVALEDGVADTNSLINVGNGRYFVKGREIKDSHVPNKDNYDVVEAFSLSSNVALSRLVYDNYKENPQEFINHLYNLGLDQKLNLPIIGEGKPYIPTTESKGWSSEISLRWISFGYQVQFTPLQILTFYNAIANNGEMVKPQFVERTTLHGETIETFGKEVINPAICSKNTLKKVQLMMRDVVTHGTAKNIHNPHLAIAGKTGTTQQNYWLKDVTDYQASFAGYFPADAPQYSCIVVINKPKNGYYGSEVAAPVFEEIAQKIYSSTPMMEEIKENSDVEPKSKKTLATNNIDPNQPFPDFKGMEGYKALALLENSGFKVSVSGNGMVRNQYPKPGRTVSKQQLIELRLQ